MKIPVALFPLGQVVATRAALDALAMEEIRHAIGRHQAGDWGDDLDPEDRRANDEAMKTDERILSSYHAEDGTKFWIITEADRSTTTVLLPEDY